MDSVLERGIVKCFPEDERLQRIVRQEFLKSSHKDRSKVDNLAFMAIKSIMHEEMMTDEMNVYAQYIYKLIFREHITDMTDFCKREPMSKGTTSDRNPGESEGIDSRKAQFHRMRSDGSIMFAIVNQEMPQFYDGRTQIIVTRKTLQIRIAKHYIAEIPHRNGLEYDTHWAEKFAKMVMLKYAEYVSIEIDGEELPAEQLNPEYMGDFLNKSIIDKLPRVIPSEGWEQYISEERLVYVRYDDYIDDATDFLVVFLTRYHYYPGTDNYWGYLEND